MGGETTAAGTGAGAGAGAGVDEGANEDAGVAPAAPALVLDGSVIAGDLSVLRPNCFRLASSADLQILFD